MRRAIGRREGTRLWAAIGAESEGRGRRLAVGALASVLVLAVLVLAGIATSAALPSPASASGVVGYVEGGNVFIHAADGSARRQITTNGTADNGHVLAGVTDNGKIVTSFGPSSSKTWFFFNPAGSSGSEGPNLVPMRQCGGLSSAGPVGPRLHPTGDLVAYGYFCNYGPPSYGIDTRLAVDNPAVFTAGSNTADVASGYALSPTWFGKRLVVSDGTKIFVQEDHPDSPFRMGFDVWLVPDSGFSLDRAEIARKGNRALVEISDDAGTSATHLGTYTGTPPGGTYEDKCELAASGDAELATFSADGTQVAWKDNGGVKVATVDLNAATTCLAPGTTKVLSAKGDIPRTSAYTLPAGGGSDGGGGGTDGGSDAPSPNTAPVTTITKAPPKKVRTAKRKMRAKFKFRADKPATFQCKLDRRPWKRCASPYKAKVKRGKHVFRVRATDRAGNTGKPAVHKWKVVRRRR